MTQHLALATDPSQPDNSSDFDEDDELLTVDETAAWLKVPVSWIYDHTRRDARDGLPVIRLGKYLRFRRIDVRAYLRSKVPATRI